MDSPADYSLLAPFLCKGDPVLHRDDADSEASRQRFRQFQYIAEAGPREVFRKLSELCSQWLKPRMRSVEQILELLVLEQFLTILPTHLEARVSTYCPENKERLFSLIEDLQREHERPEYQVRKEFGAFVLRPKEAPRQLGMDQMFYACVIPQPFQFSLLLAHWLLTLSG
jgi:hypothetical protein